MSSLDSPTSDSQPFLFKARVMHDFRSLLDREGFVEVTTPVLRKHSGDQIHSRLAVSGGGFLRDSAAFALRCNLSFTEKVFELGPCFRPDTVDETHLQEFTMLDLYWRSATLSTAVDLAGRLVRSFYKGPIERLSVAERIRTDLGVDLASDKRGNERLHSHLAKRYSRHSDRSYGELIDLYVTSEIEPLSVGRCLIVSEFPTIAEVCARPTPGTEHLSDRVEFQIDGVEVVHAYTDEPDPIALATRAAEQNAFGPEERMMCDYLEQGIVPGASSGFGIGIERFCRACLRRGSVRDFVASSAFSHSLDGFSPRKEPRR